MIECLTLIVHSIGKEDSKSFILPLLDLLMNLQENISDKTDPLKIYILWGWQRLFLVLKTDLLPYMSRIMPPLLKLLTLALTQEITEEKEEEINPEINSSINLISTLVEEISESLASNLLILIQLVLPIATNSQCDDDLRKAAAKILPKILETLKKTNESECRKYGSYFVAVFLQTICEEMEPVIIREFIIVIKDCTGILGSFLSEFELSEVSKKIIKVIYDSDQRKDQEKKNEFEEIIDVDEKELLNERINNEEDLQIAVAQLIGILFKTHRDLCVKFAEFLYTEVILRVCHANLSDKIHKLCLVLIDDMIEYLGRDLLKEKWLKMAEILTSFLTDPCSFVREAANYGIGLFAEQSKEEFANYSQVFVCKILEALKIRQNPEEKQRVYLHCRDNIIAALGKIIYYHADCVELQEIMKVWIENLPIKYEKFECYFQHELLVSIALSKRELVFRDFEVLKHVIRIFAEILDSRLINEKIANAIVTCLKKWIIEEKDEKVIEIAKSLTPLQQKVIDCCLN